MIRLLSVRTICLAPTLTLLLACRGSGGSGSRGDDAPVVTERRVAQDAQALSRELFDLVDRAASYRSSHRGRSPASLRILGIDSLTPTTARWLTLRSGGPEITVAFRRPDPGGVASCTGGLAVLEDLALEGKIHLRCRASDGTTRTVDVDPSAGP